MADQTKGSSDIHRVHRSAVNVRGLALFVLSFQTLGIIYSDIGTSPLYVLNGIWPASGPVPPKEDVIGGISAIIWSLTLLPLLKYVGICLNFGTHEGEGGTFALFQGLYPPEDKDFDADRTLTGDSARFSTRQPMKLTSRLRFPLLAWSLLGTALTLSDGILTPAVSVTSAVGGIAVAKPSVISDIVPISIAFLVFLFLIQFRGTSQLSFCFAPITFLWFCLLAATGIYNIVQYPGIFRAFDPSRAVMLFVRTGDYSLLSGVLLAVTGCEALFANLGQFNKSSIQFSFATVVYPSLCLAYLGQGARLIVDGEAVLPNLFYSTIPGPPNNPLFWIVYVFAILATLIASQAMISATFSLVQQLMNMHSLPQFRMIYTSETSQGQVYIPVVNFALMVAVIIFVVAFKNLGALTNAYGFAVATVMFTTTVLIALQMKFVKGWPAIFAVVFFVLFGFFDGLFWGAALVKVPEGAWVPLMIGLILVVVMLFWTWAKGLEDKFDGSNRMNLRHLILPNDSDDSDVFLRLGPTQSQESDVVAESEESHELEMVKKPGYYILDRDRDAGQISKKRELPRINTCAVFHKLTVGKGVPHSFVGFIRQWPALPRVVIFLAVRTLPVARVSPEDRYALTKVRSIQGFYGVTYYLGFRDDFDVKMNDIIDRICDLETRADSRSLEVVEEIRHVTARYTHIVPHYHVVSKRSGRGTWSTVKNWVRSFLIEEVYRRLDTMFPETENWTTSDDEIIRVGVTAAI